MSLYRVELKRQLKTRSVQLLLLLSLFLTLLISCTPIFSVEFVYQENGQEVTVKGPKAISKRREAWKDFSGKVTPEKLAAALTQYIENFHQYGTFLYMPPSEYDQKIAPIDCWILSLSHVHCDPATGHPQNTLDFTEEDALNFYNQYSGYFDAVLQAKLAGHPTAIRQAKALHSSVQLPFSYYPGFNDDALEYLILLVFVLTIIAALIAAPIFSSDCQTGSDNILRCAKYGRAPLALAKIKASLTITSLMYLVCMGFYLLTEGFAFGWDSLKTSVQLFCSVSSPLPITIGQLMLLSAGAGLIAYLATVLYTLFLSALCSSVYAAASLSFLLCMLPVLASSFLPESIEQWICFFLPNGGIGLYFDSFLYEALTVNFLHLGAVSLWYPLALLLSSVLEIPLWLFASLRAYQRHTL